MIITLPPFYSTLVLFGKEKKQSVQDPIVFRRLVELLSETFHETDCHLKSCGYVPNDRERGRNVAPRRGLITAKKIDEWLAAMKVGRFEHFEMFDGTWSGTHFPLVYGSIGKMWGFPPDWGHGSLDRIERTEVGAENHISVAIGEGAIPNATELLEQQARELTELTSGSYGFLQPRIRWDLDTGCCGMRTRMINYRWHDYADLDYQGGRYKMSTRVARVYWGNLVSRRHIKEDKLRALPRSILSCIEEWGKDLLYVRFTRDPQSDKRLHDRVARAFNLIPSKPPAEDETFLGIE